MDYELYITEIRAGVYRFDEAHMSTGYLIVGSDKACMIDSMNGYNDIYAAIRKITDKPVVLVNTHGHPDHIHGNIYFDRAYIHPADRPIAEFFDNEPEFIKICDRTGLKMPPYEDIREGDVIDLGDRQLEIYELPGHTPGGILLLLRQERMLFVGDGINHHLWMMLEHSVPEEEFIRNLDRIMFLEKEADAIYHGHSRDYDDISLMRCVREGMEEICKGDCDLDSDYTYFGGTQSAKQHPFKCLPDRHYSQDDHVIIHN